MYIVFREVNSPTRGIFMCAIEGYSRPIKGHWVINLYNTQTCFYEKLEEGVIGTALSVECLVRSDDNKWLAEGRIDKYDDGNYIYEVEILEMQPDIRKHLDE